MPAVGALVNEPAYAQLKQTFPHALVVDAIREQLAAERGNGSVPASERVQLVHARLTRWTSSSLVPVINATGVVLHTNLGRAPVSESAARAAATAATRYTNLELDLASGRRGERAALVEPLLCRLTGAEAALVVNNNAAAVLLALTALCRGREVVVSRGQQVEIGGSFRMPDVMRLSGARMVEVGTTNRTRVHDYADAITPRTAALMRVHTSNFRLVGFTESAGLEELSRLAHARDVLLLDDLGSGALEPVADEPAVKDSVKRADVVMFSGDKLLGGPQAGVAIGRRDSIRRMARHPLARAVRVDKMTLAALEATLRETLLGKANPVQRMLTSDRDRLRRRAALWVVKLAERGIDARLIEGASAAGAGSLPERQLPTVLVALPGPASRIQAQLRRGAQPVLARIEQDACCLDPRTVLDGEDETLLDLVEAAAAAATRKQR